MIVRKYGGSSVESVEKIHRIADRIKIKVLEGEKLVVVVSAMGKTTDNLIALARQASSNPPLREMDMLMATGEQVSAALLAISLNDIQVKAISRNAFQQKITTTGDFGNARIMDIDMEALNRDLSVNDVVVVTGFQGVTETGDFTTLGRGGSDTTAVAIAAKTGTVCEIYSDVPGIYTCDPRDIPGAKKLDYITYDEMLELAALGAKVLHSRAVEIAKKHNVTIYCASTFSDERGTYVVRNIPEWLEQPVITGLTADRGQIRFSIGNIPGEVDGISKFFAGLTENNVNVDMISTFTEDCTTRIAFTVKNAEAGIVSKLMQERLDGLDRMTLSSNDDVSKISAVGVGMKSVNGVATRLFNSLGCEGIKILGASTSEMRISVLVSGKDLDKALAALAEEFGLAC